jgi:predicted DNA-binding transcriptional regulator YafY
MQIHRLIEMVYMLLDKRTTTAKTLAERFEVSTRTIYRDIDVLSSAGIPIYTNKGQGGGIGLLDDFVLNKSLLSEQERQHLVTSLQSLRALKLDHADTALEKLRSVFRTTPQDWIEVDFSGWGGGERERETFRALKTAILNDAVVSFQYVNGRGERQERIVEPAKLLFKGRGWYLFGHCRAKAEDRLFKLTRLRELRLMEERFSRPRGSLGATGFVDRPAAEPIALVLRIAASLAYRVYDEFDPDRIRKNEDGSFTVSVDFPEGEWVYGYILSFGSEATVLGPERVRTAVAETLERALRNYRECDALLSDSEW